MYRKALLFIAITVSLSLAGWGQRPAKWDDFQIGIVNNDRTEWDTPMRAALDAGYKLDRRYIYIDNLPDVTNFWGSSQYGGTKNWSKAPFYVSKGVRPAIVIYILQRGGDSYFALSENAKDATFMKQYFEAIKQIADSSKGQAPIYVLEPDVWGYVLQHAHENKVANHYDEPCRINDLGLPWLTEFDNKLSNLPGAIIKTLKLSDPDCYAGILMAFWAYKPENCTALMIFQNAQDRIDSAAMAEARFVDTLLRATPYRGDFLGVEKNGSDAGYWKVQDSLQGTTGTVFARGPMYYWNDEDNSQWIGFSKMLGQYVNLPLLGWQISLGHEGLPNTDNRFEDTFFPYFFDHTDEYIKAGFIGMLAGCANQGRGTVATIDAQSGDGGWFYGKLAEFDKQRPYSLDIVRNREPGIRLHPANGLLRIVATRDVLKIQGAANSQCAVEIATLTGRTVQRYTGVTPATIPLSDLSAGVFVLRARQNGEERTLLLPQTK
jgi:hypothetical protein